MPPLAYGKIFAKKKKPEEEQFKSISDVNKAYGVQEAPTPAPAPAPPEINKNKKVIYPKTIKDTYKIEQYNPETKSRETTEFTRAEYEKLNKIEGKQFPQTSDEKVKKVLSLNLNPEQLAGKETEIRNRELAAQVGNVSTLGMQSQQGLFESKTGLLAAGLGAGAAGAGIAAGTATGGIAALAGLGVVSAKFAAEARSTASEVKQKYDTSKSNIAILKRAVNAGAIDVDTAVEAFNENLRTMRQAEIDLKKLGDTDVKKWLSGVSNEQAEVDEYLNKGGLEGDISLFRLAILQPNPKAEEYVPTG